MADKRGIALAGIVGFPEPARTSLAELWITTAEELVAAARQENGVAGLATHLKLSQADTTALVSQAVAALPDAASYDVTPHMIAMGALDAAEGRPPEEEPVPFGPPLPEGIDLHDRMPPVRDQGLRPTCVAHACVAVREFLLGPQSAALGDLSEQHLYWNCKQRDNHPQEGGTWIHFGMDALKTEGVCVEALWRYNSEPRPGDEGQGPPPQAATADAIRYRIEHFEALQPRWVKTNLCAKLAEEKPIAFTVPVYSYWTIEPAWSTGDVRMPLSTEKDPQGHAMCMVGYQLDLDVPGGGYFIVRNSWGTAYGARSLVAPGYARIPFAYLEKFGQSAYTAGVVTQTTSIGRQGLLGWLRRLFGRAD